jgi:AcrR family transcriptional regulator
MKTGKDDRRSQRTRRLLAAALVALLYERRYADITVQAILDRANIGRTTFYAHYWDKDDLLSSEMERVIGVMTQVLDATPGDRLLRIPSLALLAHLRDQRALYDALARGQALDMLLATIKTRLCAQLMDHWRRLAVPADDLTQRVAAEGVVGMFLTLLQWWLAHATHLTPERLDAYFQQLALPGVRAALGLAE